MTQEGKDKIITRAIHFIATNTNDKSYRIGQAIIAELDLVKKLTLTHDVKSDSEQLKDKQKLSFEDWLRNLSQEELAWYEGKYVEVFLSL
jgi:hypothetical protein